MPINTLETTKQPDAFETFLQQAQQTQKPTTPLANVYKIKENVYKNQQKQVENLQKQQMKEQTRYSEQALKQKVDTQKQEKLGVLNTAKEKLQTAKAKVSFGKGAGDELLASAFEPEVFNKKYNDALAEVQQTEADINSTLSKTIKNSSQRDERVNALQKEQVDTNAGARSLLVDLGFDPTTIDDILSRNPNKYAPVSPGQKMLNTLLDAAKVEKKSKTPRVFSLVGDDPVGEMERNYQTEVENDERTRKEILDLLGANSNLEAEDLQLGQDTSQLLSKNALEQFYNQGNNYTPRQLTGNAYFDALNARSPSVLEPQVEEQDYSKAFNYSQEAYNKALKDIQDKYNTQVGVAQDDLSALTAQSVADVQNAKLYADKAQVDNYGRALSAPFDPRVSELLNNFYLQQDRIQKALADAKKAQFGRATQSKATTGINALLSGGMSLIAPENKNIATLTTGGMSDIVNVVGKNKLAQDILTGGTTALLRKIF
jgi:hypothetical protein